MFESWLEIGPMSSEAHRTEDNSDDLLTNYSPASEYICIMIHLSLALAFFISNPQFRMLEIQLFRFLAVKFDR